MEPVGSLLRLPTHTKLPYMELHGATKLIFIYDNIFLVVKPNPACVWSPAEKRPAQRVDDPTELQMLIEVGLRTCVYRGVSVRVL